MSKKWKKIVVMILASVFVLPFFSQNAEADVVTDYLAIRVGYMGMELTDYVEVGNYHWSELYQNMPLYSYAYSYYQDGNFNKFTAVVDSANGFLITDILDYAHIYYGDIYNLKFYVVDHNGIQASFDRDDLFRTRYYFRDFPYNARYYDENGEAVIDTGRCWNDCEEVPPMLAIEDNWASFSEEFEHALPDFDYMTSGNRFRLLFGQTNPEESMTSLSAKYVSCVYVTLYGEPVIGEIPELDGAYGAHEVTMTVKTDNESIRNALSQLLQMNSTDEAVMVINGYTVTPDDFYSDIAHVTVQYEIVGEGTASFSTSVAGMTVKDSTGGTPTVTAQPEQEPGGTTEPGEEQEPGGTAEPGEEQIPSESRTETGTESDPTAQQTETPQQNNNEDQQSQGTVNTGDQGRNTAESAVASAGSSTPQNPDHSAALTSDASEILTAEESADALDAGGGGAYVLSGDAADKLSEGLMQIQPQIEPDVSVTQVMVSDTTERDKEEQKKWMIRIGIACVGLVVIGIAFGNLSFRRNLGSFSDKRNIQNA